MRIHIGLWVVAGVLLSGGALADDGLGGNPLGDGNPLGGAGALEASAGSDVDLAPRCYGDGAPEAGAHAKVGDLGVDQDFTLVRAAPCTGLERLMHGSALAAYLDSALIPLNFNARHTQRLDADATVDREERQTEAGGEVAFEDSFTRSESQVAASTHEGASGRVLLDGSRVADLQIKLAQRAAQQGAQPLPESARWSVDQTLLPAWEPAKDDAPRDSWGMRASRSVEAVLRPFLPAAAPFAPVPVAAGGADGAGLLDDLRDAQVLGLAAAGLVPAALAALYQRFTASTTMQHERRAAIHKALAAWPNGATAGEVARALDMKRKTVEYHLHYCAKAGLVRVGRGPDGTRRYSLGALPQRPGVTERLLELIRERPGLSTAELAGALGVPRDGVDRRVKEFAIRGVVECRLVDGERRMFPGTA